MKLREFLCGQSSRVRFAYLARWRGLDGSSAGASAGPPSRRVPEAFSTAYRLGSAIAHACRMLWKVTFSSPAAVHSRRHIAVMSFWMGARRRYTKAYRWTSWRPQDHCKRWRGSIMTLLAASASADLGIGQEHPRVSAFVRCQKAVSSRDRPSWLSCDFCDCQACTFAHPLTGVRKSLTESGERLIRRWPDMAQRNACDRAD